MVHPLDVKLTSFTETDFRFERREKNMHVFLIYFIRLLASPLEILLRIK